MPEPPGLAPTSEIRPEAEAGSSCEPGRGHPCPDCSESFKSSRGLGVHRAAKHRAQRDEDITQARLNIVKARWDPEERQLLAEKEAELTRQGVRLMNMKLREAFPHRTLESIKGQRKQASHKKLVADLLAAPLPDPSLAAQSIPEPPPDLEPGPEPEPTT